jgi:hypothetical protein
MTPAAGVSWIVEHDGIRLLRIGAGCAELLGYPEAAIWDLAVRGAGESAMAPKIAAIAACSTDEARRIIARTLAAWRERGVVNG